MNNSEGVRGLRVVVTVIGIIGIALLLGIPIGQWHKSIEATKEEQAKKDSRMVTILGIYVDHGYTTVTVEDMKGNRKVIYRVDLSETIPSMGDVWVVADYNSSWPKLSHIVKCGN